MGPGPSDVPARVLAALGQPTVGHLDPQFVALMDETKRLLQYLFQTKSELTLPISAPGSSAMEACFVNLLEAGDKVIVCRNGVFGLRMTENVERSGAQAVTIDDEWGQPVSLDKLAEAIKANPDAKVIAFVHAETSTGAQSDAQAIAKMAQDAGMLTIMDCVTSLGGTPVKIDEWGIDAAYSGSQKCLSCVPGIAPITFGEKAQQVIQNRKQKVQSWFSDQNLIMAYWGGGAKRAYHHTAPVNNVYALHESLLMIKKEGLEIAWARHAQNHQALKAGLQVMGIEFVVDEAHRLPQLNAVTIPEYADDAATRSQLLSEFNLEIGAGLGALAGKVWRIGLMGHSSSQHNVEFCLNALETSLLAQGGQFEKGAAIAAAQAVYQNAKQSTAVS
ncbi:MAG: alanine--glyoxylate aminotransferase family protein [Pseudomonadota bacterium]|nr:alanine--glyoxylate aminotransferase family protein [Pseudomonadota bacterium]